MKSLFIPQRFRTAEDADLFQECLDKNQPFPEDKLIRPFVKHSSGTITWNPEYQNAPFEMTFI